MTISAANLSCYTTSLTDYLGAETRNKLAHRIRLAVRTDLPGGELAFSQHTRIDTGEDWELGYRGSPRWEVARDALAAEIAEHGAVVAMANTRFLAWSPHCGKADVTHWIVLDGLDENGWSVTDNFAALLPSGEQHPHRGRMDDEQLRTALTPPGTLSAELALRDKHALGVPVPMPPLTHYRWLARQPSAPRCSPDGAWLSDLPAVLEFLRDAMASDDRVLCRHADDLWAAARHHQFKLAVLTEEGALPPADARAATAGWAALPRALRFAADSSVRGRSRPGVVTRAFDEVIGTMSTAVQEIRIP